MRLFALDVFLILKSRATGDGDSVTGESTACGSVLTALAVLFAPPHPHCDFLGMAAVMLEHPQFCGCKCGHAVSGRPGFLTGTIRRSLACVHFVERCPRMHGSLNTDVSFRARPCQVYIIPGHLHAVYDRHFESIMSEYGPMRQRESVRCLRFLCAVPLSEAASISRLQACRGTARKGACSSRTALVEDRLRLA